MGVNEVERMTLKKSILDLIQNLVQDLPHNGEPQVEVQLTAIVCLFNKADTYKGRVSIMKGEL